MTDDLPLDEWVSVRWRSADPLTGRSPCYLGEMEVGYVEPFSLPNGPFRYAVTLPAVREAYGTVNSEAIARSVVIKKVSIWVKKAGLRQGARG